MSFYSLYGSFRAGDIKPSYGQHGRGQRQIETLAMPKDLYADLGEGERLFKKTTISGGNYNDAVLHRSVPKTIIGIAGETEGLNELVTVTPVYTKEVDVVITQRTEEKLVRVKRGLRSGNMLRTQVISVEQRDERFMAANKDGNQLYSLTYQAWRLQHGLEEKARYINKTCGIRDDVGRPSSMIVQEILPEDDALERVAAIQRNPVVARLFAQTVAQEFLAIPFKDSLQCASFGNTDGQTEDLMGLNVNGAMTIQEVLGF